MKPKRRRLAFVGLGLLLLGAAAALVLTALEDNIVFFYSPTDLETKALADGQRIRLGGMVADGSVVKEGTNVRFVITDYQNERPVAYVGVLPDLFREGQGVVTEGRMGPDGVFRADEVLAKHDENYMPPEVAEALEASGEWRREEGSPPRVMTQ